MSHRVLRQRFATAATTAITRTTAVTPLALHRARQNLMRDHYPDKALEIYSSVTNHFITPFSSRYSQQRVVERLAKANRFDDIETLIESLKNDSKFIQEPFFCNVIRCYGKAGLFDRAMKLYDEMEHFGMPRSCFSFNALLAAGNDSGVFDRVHEVFNEMPRRYGFAPDEISYAILINSYCGKGEPEMGLKIIEEVMEGKRVEVTPSMFTTVMDAFYKIGKVDEAESVWDEMLEKGCMPDVATWNVKIVHALTGEPERIEKLIVEMERSGLRPDKITYNYMLTCYCMNDRLDEALTVFEYLEKGRFWPLLITFTTLISYLCKKEEYTKAYDVFKKSVFHNKVVDFETLKGLAEGLMKKNMKSDAEGLICTAKQLLPPSVNAWKKVEVELGLVKGEGSADCNVPAV